jgi:acetyl-CoA synthetase
MFESLPTYPDYGRYWDMVQRHKINIFYTAPTAIRALMKMGDDPVKKYDLSSLKTLGTVGEPINPEAWKWYYEVVGGSRCDIVDTYWQTETGAHAITGLSGVTPMKSGSASFPFYGIELVVIEPTVEGSGDTSIRIMEGNDVSGILAIKTHWPSMVRTVYGDHQRFMNTYLAAYPGYYFAGDGCYRDSDGYYWITGRVDDVLNVSGHRLGSAEIESALVSHECCIEAAVIGVPHDVKGEGIFAYCCLKDGFPPSPELVTALRMQVRKNIGGIAMPDTIILLEGGLPKTRSGKIMRRVLRKVACHEEDSLGDTSTLADPSVVDTLIKLVAKASK